jgi:hypothetical protein
MFDENDKEIKQIYNEIFVNVNDLTAMVKEFGEENGPVCNWINYLFFRNLYK